VAAIKAVLEHPELELVGAWVHSKAKAGKDIGVLAGVDPIGVTATDSIDEILAMDADAVIYAPLLPNVDEVTALLRSGKNVISPVGWFYPGESEAAPLRAAAVQGGVTLHGAGIGPGAATGNGAVPAGAQCFADAECVRGTVCSLFACRPVCDDAGDCAPNELCFPDFSDNGRSVCANFGGQAAHDLGPRLGGQRNGLEHRSSFACPQRGLTQRSTGPASAGGVCSGSCVICASLSG
jgi:hypothetical protein